MKERKNCKEMIRDSLQGTMEDLRKLWSAYCRGEEYVEDLGSIWEYGLCFDYVGPNTFRDQGEPYFRYQLSWGGPTEEFRFYCGPDLEPYRVEYWYLDWFDSAKIELEGKNLELLLEIWNWFKEGGAVQNALERR
jgi:hypothetical protein